MDTVISLERSTIRNTSATGLKAFFYNFRNILCLNRETGLTRKSRSGEMKTMKIRLMISWLSELGSEILLDK